MALTITTINGRPESLGSKRFEIVNLAFDSSYPTGGESLTPGDIGFQTIDFILIEPSGGYTFEYDHTNEKVVAYYADYDAAADGPLVEVPNETDIDALTGVRAFVIGTV